jgi:hypothetical protein
MTFKATVQEIRVAQGFKGCRVLPGAIAEIACQSAVSRRVTQIFNQIRRIARTSIQNESLTIARSWRPLGGLGVGLTLGSDGNRSLPFSASRCGAFVGTVGVVMNTPFTVWRSALSAP